VRTVHHPTTEEIELPEVLHALSDPVRLEIVHHLAAGAEKPCGSLGVSVSRSTLSHHLKVLREAGLTWTRADGTQRLVSLRRDELERRFPGLLDSVLGAARAA
jgi:DNA-binding transcriptional ArsR family regulator